MKGTYYDGVTSRPYKAELSVNRHYLILDFPEEVNKAQERWDHYQIKTSDIPGSSKVSLNYGPFPHKSIEVDAKQFFQDLENTFPQAPYLNTSRNFLLSKGLASIMGLLGIFVAIVLALYFLVIPIAINLIIKTIPVETEISLGKQMAESTLSTEKIDKKKTEIMKKFLKNLKLKTKYPIEVTVVESDVKNAFAIPGGQIVVYTALLNEMQRHDELVALLGHEIAHVEERHTLKMLGKSIGLYIVVSAIFQDISGIVAVLVDNASALERLSYNRDLESEADEKGLEVVLENKVDPKGMIDLFNHLKGDDKGDVIPEFLLTHPSLDKRIEELQKKLSKIKYQVIPNDSLLLHWKGLSEKKQ